MRALIHDLASLLSRQIICLDIVALSTLYVVGEVLEGDLFQVLPGLSTGMTFTGRSNIKLTGQIEHVRMKMDAVRRSWGAVVSVDNRAELLRPGMSRAHGDRSGGSRKGDPLSDRIAN